VVDDSKLLRITKGGRTLPEISEVKDWVTLTPEKRETTGNQEYKPIVWGLKVIMF